MSPEELEAAQGLFFRDKSLLIRALTHRSHLNESQTAAALDNERLEFLGDAVLDFLTGEFLYHRFPEMREGELTNLRSALVRTETLARFAQDIHLGQYLFLGRGEEMSQGRKRPAGLKNLTTALLARRTGLSNETVATYTRPSRKRKKAARH